MTPAQQIDASHLDGNHEHAELVAVEARVRA
jgi:hypothetical protein